jgi:hypothetical protein
MWADDEAPTPVVEPDVEAIGASFIEVGVPNEEMLLRVIKRLP